MRLIDADGLKSQITRYHMSLTPRYISKLVDAEIGDVIDIVDEQPTIEARPVVRGEWIEKPHTDGFGGHYFLYHCSRCDTPNAQKRNFCNECGADMRGEDDGKERIP